MKHHDLAEHSNIDCHHVHVLYLFGELGNFDDVVAEVVGVLRTGVLGVGGGLRESLLGSLQHELHAGQGDRQETEGNQVAAAQRRDLQKRRHTLGNDVRRRGRPCGCG